MDQTFRYTDQYIPTEQEVKDFFIQQEISPDHATAWHTKMQSNSWLDGKGNKIMNWRRYAGFKITDLKTGNSADIQRPHSYANNAAPVILLAPNLTNLCEAIIELYSNKTGKVYPTLLNSVKKQVQVFQEKHKLSAEDTEFRLREILRFINEPGFSYEDFWTRLNEAMITV